MRTERPSTVLGKMPTIVPIRTASALRVIVDEAAHPPPVTPVPTGVDTTPHASHSLLAETDAFD